MKTYKAGNFKYQELRQGDQIEDLNGNALTVPGKAVCIDGGIAKFDGKGFVTLQTVSFDETIKFIVSKSDLETILKNWEA